MKLFIHSVGRSPAPCNTVRSKQKLDFKKDRGFTLVELMIALVLGLLISAAALQVFYTSSVNSRRQEASSQIQDNSIFGFSQIQQHLRRTNYGAKSTSAYDEYFMNHLTPQGGVVLTAPTGASGKWLNNNLSGLVLDSGAIPASLLSSSASTNSISNLNGIANSDQLTIQYQSGQDGLFDCEGTVIPKDFYVIERYFVRMDSTATPAVPGLACASAIYNYEESAAGSATGIDLKAYMVPGESTATPNNLAGVGTIIISNVDYFRVMLGVSDSTGFATDPANSRIGYMAIPSSSALNTQLNNRRIVSLQLGILARSDNPTVTPQANSELSFTVLDKANASLNAAAVQGPTYLRSVYESTVLLRNARGGL
ncbi:PilW family protein [Psychrobacter sp. S1-30-MNA-CIBAN-0213]|uniref:PilW family protein n=1 Tax=Psychrobacter sp. S1-30-MNA-CIBAN-0213 TaxID=3140456 RepID=UPI00332A3A4E